MNSSKDSIERSKLVMRKLFQIPRVSEDSNVSIPNFEKFNANSDNIEQSCKLLNCACSGSEKSKADGRRKPRSQKQIEACKRNFNARKPIELRINELDLRLRHLQSLFLSLLRRSI